MKKTIQAVFLTLLAAQVLVVGQGADAKKIVADIRAALGGDEKLAALKTIAVEGQVSKVVNESTSAGSDFELAIELPGKYMKREVFANLGGMQLKRRVGFSGKDVIEEMDTPPSMGGNVHIMRAPGAGMVGGTATPEQLAAQKAQLLASSRREFARLMVGMTGGTSPEFPVEFVYAGQAEARDGKADILDVKGPDGFTARLFVDGKTHLPLMLTWMDKEPLSMMVTNDGRGGGMRSGGGGVQVMTSTGMGGTPEELAKMREDMAARMAEAEAKRRVVEYRLFYGEYKAVDGLKMPTRVQRMVDGVATEEMTLDKIRINGKIDPAKFAVVK
jgi:hypothetical protein